MSFEVLVEYAIYSYLIHARIYRGAGGVTPPDTKSAAKSADVLFLLAIL